MDQERIFSGPRNRDVCVEIIQLPRSRAKLRVLNAGLLLENLGAPPLGEPVRGPEPSREAAGEMTWAEGGEGLSPAPAGSPAVGFPRAKGRRGCWKMSWAGDGGGGRRGTAPLIAGHVVLVL